MTSDPKKMEAWIADDRVHFGEDETSVPCIKSYLKDREYQAPYSVFYQDGRAATKRLRELMGCDCFDFPKDELVLKELVGMMTGDGDIVMDFFAGSGTTGHAVIAQCVEDGKPRRFILVQLPEPLDPERPEQAEAAAFCDRLKSPRHIATLTKERLRRAGRQLADGRLQQPHDFGFRTYRLAYSSIRAWGGQNAAPLMQLEDAVENILPNRSDADLLNELLLKRGLDLCVPIEGRTIAGKAVYSVGGGVLLACLDKDISLADSEELAMGIVEWHADLQPAGDTAVVFRDNAFADDVVKCNVVAILVQHGFDQNRVRSL